MSFVVTKYACHNKTFVTTNTCLLQQKYFVVTRCVLLRQKWYFWQFPPMIHYSATNTLWITPSFECQHTIAQVNWPQQTQVKTSHNRLCMLIPSLSLYIHKCTHAHTHTCIHTHTHTHTHTCIHTHARMHIHTKHAHIYTHTCCTQTKTQCKNENPTNNLHKISFKRPSHSCMKRKDALCFHHNRTTMT